MIVSAPARFESRLRIPSKFAFFLSIAGLVMMFFFWRGAAGRIVDGYNDFLGFYAGARLCGTPGLYDAAKVTEVQLAEARATGPALRLTRPPFYALLLSPLGLLPYQTAYLVWTLLNAGALAGFIALWRETDRNLVLAACCCSIPVAASFANGQDIPLLLFYFALAMRLFRDGRHVWAGLALSLCAAKYHLFLLVPLLFLAQGLWRVMLGGSIGAMALIVLSFLAGGRTWLGDYWRVLTDSAVHPAVTVMPNLHGFTMNMAHGNLVLGVLSLLIGAACWVIARRLEFRIALAAVISGSLLVSFHSYVADAALLIPALLILAERGALEKRLAFGLLSPVPWFLLMRGGIVANTPRAALVVLLAVTIWRALQSVETPNGSTRGAIHERT